MGKKKPFIDKKKSTTYSLIYRSQDDAQADPEGSDRILQPTDSVGVPDVQTEQVGRWPPGHPLAWLQAERANRVTDDARRREIVSLGLPDDGYDYMKHLRIVGGPGSTSLAQVPQSSESSRRLKEGIELVDEDATGPSIFVPATRHKQVAVRDEKMVDATQLVLRSQAADDDEAEQVAGGITAFSKELQRVKGPDREELEEIAAAMSALEDIDDAEQFDAQAMDDSFVLQAAEWDGVAVEPGQDEDEADDLEEVSSGDESDEEEDGIRGYPGYKGDGVSLASSYWRKERSDRNEQLALIDERFERLAFQYDEDQIGDLDDKDNEEITGALAISHFDSILDEFIEKNKSIIPGGSGDVEADEEAEARRLTKANAHELASDCSEEAGSALVDHAIEEAFAEKQQAERWDCESVLSLRSNLDNHPGRISEPAVRKASKTDKEKIKLSSKTGLPIARETEETSSSESDEHISVASTIRRKDESKDEKRARKAAVKESQRLARERKKELKTMFKKEQSKMKGLSTATHSTVPLA